MTTQQAVERPITRPNRRSLLFDGLLRGTPFTRPGITTVQEPDVDEAPDTEDSFGTNRRGEMLDRLVDYHEPQVRRGFYSLLESAGIAPAAPGEELEDPACRVVLVDLRTIAPNPYLPPVRSNSEVMERLVESIRVNGLLEPLQVMPAPSDLRSQGLRYWTISGEHRRLAAEKAGLRQVQVIVRQVSLRAGLQLFLAQTLHPYEFLPLEHARVFNTLTDDMGMTPDRLAVSVGARVEDVETELSFLGLDESMQASLVERRITPDQAQVLLEAPDEDTRYQLWRYALRYRPRAVRMRKKLQELAA